MVGTARLGVRERSPESRIEVMAKESISRGESGAVGLSQVTVAGQGGGKLISYQVWLATPRAPVPGAQRPQTPSPPMNPATCRHTMGS